MGPDYPQPGTEPSRRRLEPYTRSTSSELQLINEGASVGRGHEAPFLRDLAAWTDQQPPHHVRYERYDDKDEEYLYWSQAHSYIMHCPELLRKPIGGRRKWAPIFEDPAFNIRVVQRHFHAQGGGEVLGFESV